MISFESLVLLNAALVLFFMTSLAYGSLDSDEG